MKKLIFTLLTISCIQASYAQMARVQLINNSPDSLHRFVDVWLDGQKVLDNMEYRTATPFMDLPGGAPLTLGIAPENSMTELDTFYMVTATLAPNGKYIAILNGTEEQARYTPYKPLRLDVFSMAQETGTDPNHIDVLLFHGATDLPAFDLKMGLVQKENDIAFGDFGSGYQMYPAMHSQFRITNTSGTQVLENFNFDVTPNGGEAGVLVASGFVDPTANRQGMPLTMLLVSPMGMVMDLGTAGPEDIGRIQIINNSADAKSAVIDLWMNDSLAIDNLPFRNATAFMDAYANEPVIWGIAPANSTSINDTFYSKEITLVSGEDHIAIINGIESNTGYAPMVPMDIHVLNQAKEETSQTDMEATIFHGSTDAPDPMDIRDLANGVLRDDIAYGTFTSYGNLPPMAQIFNVTDAAGTTFLRRFKTDFSQWAGQAATIVSSGFADTAANSKGARFGLFVVPASGGNFIPMTEEPVGIKDLNRNSAIKLYPNPAQNTVYIQGLRGDNNVVSVLDMAGRELMRLEGMIETINISKLSPGLYTIRLTEGENTWFGKITKQ